MVYQSKPSSKALGKRPERNGTAVLNETSPHDTPTPDGDSSNGALSVSAGILTRQKRILPTRARRGGPGVGSTDVDMNILDTLQRKGEDGPLIPPTSVFILTTDSSLVPSTSTGELGGNEYANERYFDRPEVMKSYKEQQNIQTPEYTQLTDDLLVGGRLRARGEVDSAELSDAAYEKRHRKYETMERRQRLREKEKLLYEHYKLKERIDQLRSMDYTAFLTLPASSFGDPLPLDAEESISMYLPGTALGNPIAVQEGERRRKLMLDVASNLEERYRILLPPERRHPEKTKTPRTSMSVSAEPSVVDEPVNGVEHEGYEPEPDIQPVDSPNTRLVSNTSVSARRTSRAPLLKFRFSAPRKAVELKPELKRRRKAPLTHMMDIDTISAPMQHPSTQPSAPSGSDILANQALRSTSAPLRSRVRLSRAAHSRPVPPTSTEQGAMLERAQEQSGSVSAAQNSEIVLDLRQSTTSSPGSGPIPSLLPEQDSAQAPQFTHKFVVSNQSTRGNHHFSVMRLTPTFVEADNVSPPPPARKRSRKLVVREPPVELPAEFPSETPPETLVEPPLELSAEVPTETPAAPPSSSPIEPAATDSTDGPLTHQADISASTSDIDLTDAGQVEPAISAGSISTSRQDYESASMAMISNPGKGKRRWMPAILVAASHNENPDARKTGRAVKAFGTAVPAFPDEEFHLPEWLRREIDELDRYGSVNPDTEATGSPFPQDPSHEFTGPLQHSVSAVRFEGPR